MKAFLSHSSKDKSFVRRIADKLGPARCEYDEYSFEYTLNAQAIRQTFARADLFVLFLSENSTKRPLSMKKSVLPWISELKVR
jgi:TIR domain